MMDPLDREKPWGPLGVLALIAFAIGLVYLVIRLVVVVPEWGWQVLLAPALLGPPLYYFLAYRARLRRSAVARRALHGTVVLLLAAVLSLPVAVLLYWLWAGEPP